MRLLMFLFIVLTLVVAGGMIFDLAVWGGIILLVGSLLGFAGGSGMRGSLYVGNRMSAVIIGVGLLLGGAAVVYFRGVTLQFWGTELPGAAWVLLGFVLGFLAARPEDAGVRVPS